MEINSDCLHNPEQEITVTFAVGKEMEGYYKISKG